MKDRWINWRSGLGLTDRHLRRLFLEHVGVSPVVVAQTRRTLFAKKLITETNLPFSDIAFAAGFASLRRFNEALRETYHRNPKELRRFAPPEGAASSAIELKLHYRPPYDWNAFLDFVAPRAIPGLETVEAGTYRRNGIAVRKSARENCLIARIEPTSANRLRSVAERIRFFFDLRANTNEIAAHLGKSPLMKRAIKSHPGLRLPGCWDGFELAVRAILGQQVTVKGASTLAGRLVERFGPPKAEVLADADLRSVGLTTARAETIRAFARAVSDGSDPAGRLGIVHRHDPADVRAARHRRLDRELHRDARAGRSRCVSGFRSRSAQGRGRHLGAPIGGNRRSLAAVAILRGALLVGIFARKKGLAIMLLNYDEFDSPIGRMMFASDGDAVCTLEFSDHEDRMKMLLTRRFGDVEFRHGADPMNLKAQLRDYFDGNIHALDRIPVNAGGTEFQQQVWKALRTIPAGETRSYGQLAVEVRRPKASRAVGHANSLNPVAIIVPCHRVIGASSALTGYAGGLERKRWLLRHEGALSADLDLSDEPPHRRDRLKVNRRCDPG